MYVWMFGVEMDCGDPSPVLEAQVGFEPSHRFAGSLSQPFFALLIGCTQFLEIFFKKADREVDQIALRGPARAVIQVSVGVTVLEFVLALVCEDRARLGP